MESVFGILCVFALSAAAWFVALNRKARRLAALSVRGVRRDNAEDVETVQAIVQGLGLVFGITFFVVGVGGIIGYFFE